MLLCDIPDSYQSVADYFQDIRSNYPDLSTDMINGAIKDLQIYGPIASECAPVADGLWRLSVAIGFGHKANMMFVVLKNGNYFMIHAFTSTNQSELGEGTILAANRKKGLE
jgi:hypothetical protein